jgi:hypothetical protein
MDGSTAIWSGRRAESDADRSLPEPPDGRHAARWKGLPQRLRRPGLGNNTPPLAVVASDSSILRGSIVHELGVRR